jgi:hypothetical protein
LRRWRLPLEQIFEIVTVFTADRALGVAIGCTSSDANGGEPD